MISRSRSVRVAGLALALAMPLVAANAAPTFAAGDDAVVSTVITEGNVHVESTKGLSRVTVVLCDGAPVVADNWTAEQLSGDVEVDGVVQAVFIHSGNNTTADAQALLALLAGSDAVKGDSTGAIASYDEDACEDSGGDDDSGDDDSGDDDSGDDDSGDDDSGDDGGDDDGDDGNPGGGNPGGDVTPTLSGPAPITSVLPTTIVQTASPAPTAVLGETLQQGAELPRTGSAHLSSMVTLALGLIIAGTALIAGFRRRVGSAVSPG